jgi:solute carrier family 35 (UDP-galactose transporter), member B1
MVQETLSTKVFGPHEQRFPHLSALNAVQSWVCFLWAAALLYFFGPAATERDQYPPMTAYWKAAISNFVGPALGFQSLRYISYSAQVLAKSSKMLPVMLMGALLHGKRYSALDYTCCGLISAGVALFATRSSNKVTSKLAEPSAPLGYALVLANLVLDAYTNTAQDEINTRHKKSAALQMMCWMNFWSGVYYLPSLFVVTKMGPELLAFCMEHQEAGKDVLLFCACGALGQLFIFFTIKRFGALTNTLITTTRKFFNILLSVRALRFLVVVQVFPGNLPCLFTM